MWTIYSKRPQFKSVVVDSMKHFELLITVCRQYEPLTFTTSVVCLYFQSKRVILLTKLFHIVTGTLFFKSWQKRSIQGFCLPFWPQLENFLFGIKYEYRYENIFIYVHSLSLSHFGAVQLNPWWCTALMVAYLSLYSLYTFRLDWLLTKSQTKMVYILQVANINSRTT